MLIRRFAITPNLSISPPNVQLIPKCSRKQHVLFGLSFYSSFADFLSFGKNGAGIF